MIAKTLYGLEEILTDELADLGARDITQLNRSVEFFGNEKLLYTANLWCRTATRILKPIHSFDIKNENDLYACVLKIPWEQYLDLEQTFAIDAIINKSIFDNSLYVAQRTKDAIADRFRKLAGRRPSVRLKDPDIRINVYINRNNCTLALDASGEPLFKRGYRTQTGTAPLNEVLAAGIIYKSGWDGKGAFVDAMCGSGTIAIEAALMARNMAPGLTRKDYGFKNWLDYDHDLFEMLYREAQKRAKAGIDFDIVASDKNAVQVREAAANARRGGVADDIVFEKKDMAFLEPPSPPGVLIINPPYGERMSVADIRRFYGSIGDTLKKNFTGYDAYIFTGNPEASKYIGLRTSRRIKMYNGPIECRLLKFEMYRGSRKAKYRK